MPTITVNLPGRSYPIVIGRGVLGTIGTWMDTVGLGRTVAVVSDSGVASRYGAIVIDALRASARGRAQGEGELEAQKGGRAPVGPPGDREAPPQVGDPGRGSPPSDPFMRESVLPRSGTNPITNDPIQPPSATSDDAPQSTSSLALAVSSKKQVLNRPPEPKASPDPTIVRRIVTPSRSAAPTRRRASV